MDSKKLDMIRQQLTVQQEALKVAFEPIQLIQKQFIQQIAELQPPIHEFAKNYSDSISKIVALTKDIDFESFEKFQNEFGWVEAISFIYAFKLKDILKEEGKEAVWDKLIEDLNDESTLKELSEDAAKVELIKDRMQIINIILDHHKNKNYISSIPLLLSQIEGMMWDLGVYKKIVDNQLNSKYKIDVNGRLVLDSRGQKIEWQLGELVQYLFGKTSKLTIHTEKEVYSKELRHPILHGRQINYGTPQNSTMLVLLLFTLVEKIKDETRN